jgi:hypothetical protein
VQRRHDSAAADAKQALLLRLRFPAFTPSFSASASLPSRSLNTSALSGTNGAAHSKKYARSRRRLVQSRRVVSCAPAT